MAKKKLRVAIIGCGGNMRNAHVPRLQKDGAVEIAAVADPVQSNADLLAEKWGAPLAHYQDYRLMLRQNQVDAVFISSPHSMHYEQTRYALQRGCHVLVEKPLTTSARHSRALMRLAAKEGLFLQVAYQRSYYAPHIYARQLVQQGRLGKIQGIAAYVTQHWGGNPKAWRRDPQLSGGGFFMDTGSHLVAAALRISGLEPAEVSAYLDNKDQRVDMNLVLSVRFREGALGNLSFFGGSAHHDESLAFHGDKGCLVFRLHKWQVRDVLLDGEPVQIPKRIKESDPDTALLGWIRNGGRGYEPPEYALQVASLSEAVYRSVQAKKPVKVSRG
jgi:predicted dehydrogenase